MPSASEKAKAKFQAVLNADRRDYSSEPSMPSVRTNYKVRYASSDLLCPQTEITESPQHDTQLQAQKSQTR